MASKISGDDIREYLSTGCKIVEGLALRIYGESLNHVGEKAFSEAIEVGIGNTIAALYETNVKDDEIIRVMNKHWGIDTKEAEDRLLYEKRTAPARALRYHLKMQGFTETEIQQYMRSNSVLIKLRENHELWKLKDNPQKLMKAIQELK